MPEQPERFTIDVPERVLADLRERLARTRWPDEVDGAGWDYGMNRDVLQELVACWRDAFDWRAQERRMNALAHYRLSVDGVGIHYVHERGRGPDPLPILITHGWPSTFDELHRLVPLLADPAGHGADAADAFDVVVPAIPGYPFSDRPTRRGFSYQHVAALWVRLMERLGYQRFGMHSYDVGASISGLVLRRDPARVIGYHTTEPTNPAPWLGPGSAPLSDAEREYLAYQQRWSAEEGGYMALQTTRPQTLGYGLNDSPAALAAWVLEKWHAWTVPAGGRLEDHIPRDELLAHVTLYWVSETINSANRLYWERAHHPTPVGPDERIRVPLGVLRNAQPIERAPREYVERLFVDIRAWREAGRGGHFFAQEEPQLLAEALRDFFRPLR